MKIKNVLKLIKKNYKEIAIVIILLTVSFWAHSNNMFNYPYYENDEGTYISQAWSLLKHGRLAPYTYWYDHAPAGWAFIALWHLLSGGFLTFGLSVNSGRVFMLIIHLLSSWLLYYICKKQTNSNLAGIIAVLIFSLSPLGIYFQRRVLLDNLMIFWVLFSIAILYRRNLKLSHIIVSAVFFGISVLTKENAIFFLPALIYTVYTKSHSYHKKFAVIKWFIITSLVISTYFLYALLKDEFFPAANREHVSLIETLKFQAGRGESLPFYNKDSEFYLNFIEWIVHDPLTVGAGLVATGINLVLSIKFKIFRIPAFLSTLFWIFLIRGSLVLNFYIIPLIPILAMNIGILAGSTIKILSFKNKVAYFTLSSILIAATVIPFFYMEKRHYFKDETLAQTEALHWIQENIPENSFIVIDNYALVDLRESGFNNAHWFWKVWDDPEIRQKYNNDWKNLEYILASHELIKQMGLRNDPNDPIKLALQNSTPLYYSKPNEETYLDISNYISTNGDWAAVYKLDGRDEITEKQAWNYFKEQFVFSYGQVIDNETRKTTSEGQSYAMLLAVIMDDKETFDGVLLWSKDHLQHRGKDNLFSWIWNAENNTLEDYNTATDADQDIAMALLLAYEKWGDPEHLQEAETIIEDIWEHEVVFIDGNYYLIAGAEFERDNGYVLNPSYISPAAYKIFEKYNSENDWEELADDSYIFINNLISQGNQTLLPPNWIYINSTTGELSSASRYINSNPNDYGFDAFRIYWRLALDYKWFEDERSYEILTQSQDFFKKEWNEKQNFYAIYNTDGTPSVNYQTNATNTGAMAIFSVTNENIATQINETLFESNYSFERGTWENGPNYYSHSWVLLTTLLHNDKLKYQEN